MPTLRELMQKLPADGRLDGAGIAALGELLYADGRIDRDEAEFLIELYRRAERPGPGFEAFFYRAIKRHVLADGAILAADADWLRRTLFADGTVSARELKLLRELRGEAVRTCPEFETLYTDCRSADRRSHERGDP